MTQTAGLSLSSVVQGFLFTLSAEGKAKATIHYYKGNFKRFLWFANDRKWPDDIRLIDTWKIREFLDYAGHATHRWGATGNGSENCREPSKTAGWRYFRTLRSLFRWALTEKVIDSDPMVNVKVIRPKEQPVDPYSQDEIKKYIAVCDADIAAGDLFCGTRHKAVFLLYLDSGMRYSELANLRMDEILLEKGRALVHGKGGYDRIIVFGAVTKKALWKYISYREQRVRDKAKQWLWVTEEGNRLTPAGLYAAFKRLKQRAGITSPGLIHRLRHTFAIATLRQIKDPFKLQLLLGHRTIDMTRRYTQGLKLEEALTDMETASPVNFLGLG